jgi:hypothetical protein
VAYETWSTEPTKPRGCVWPALLALGIASAVGCVAALNARREATSDDQDYGFLAVSSGIVALTVALIVAADIRIRRRRRHYRGRDSCEVRNRFPYEPRWTNVFIAVPLHPLGGTISATSIDGRPYNWFLVDHPNLERLMHSEDAIAWSYSAFAHEARFYLPCDSIGWAFLLADTQCQASHSRSQPPKITVHWTHPSSPTPQSGLKAGRDFGYSNGKFV